MVTVTKKEWMDFNPQVIYGCGEDNELEKIILNEPGWKNVDAVKNRRMYYFPCELTCRAFTNTGYFVEWLSASIYGKAFSKKTCDCIRGKADMVGKVEELLLDPRYAGFFQMALSISDNYEKGFVKDLSAFKTLSKTMAMEISEGRITDMQPLIDNDIPEVLKIAFNALVNGVNYRN